MPDNKILRDLMTRDTAPDDPGLYLNVVSEPWERECGYEDKNGNGCYGRGRIDIPASQPCDGEPGTNPDYYKQKTCPHCHGTGKVKVRCEGKVRHIVINSVSSGYDSGLQAWLMVEGRQYCKTEPIYQEPFSSQAREAFPIYKTTEALEGNIVEAFRAGTLPDSLLYDADTRPWGLRIVEVDG